MVRILKVLAVIALAAVVIMGLATTTGCGVDDNGDAPNGDVNGNPDGDVPNGELTNGEDSNGEEPADEPVEPANPDITSGLGVVLDCEEYDGSGYQYGGTVPDFTFEDALGQSYSLSDYQGKLVIINFWRINCVYCKMEMPYLEQIAADWADEDVALVTINMGDSAESVNEYLGENGFNLPIILDQEFLISTQYVVSSVPLTIYLDREGLIRAAKVGAYQSTAEIEEILEQLIAL